jgi:phospholipid/cholesterol/gamma-HCH transport system substrate-binding protein/paraquat-inducible protein B
MITKGLRVRLASQGITGAAFLEADYIDPEEFPPMEITWEPKTYYIPSVPSKITQLTESVETILEKLEEINIKGITDGLEDTLSSMNKILDEVKMSKLTEQAGQLLAELRETNKKVKPLITDASETMDSVSEELPEILAQLKRTLRRFNNFVSNEEHNVAVSTENVRLITGNLRDLTENAKKSPSQFIFGAPPPRSQPGGRQ